MDRDDVGRRDQGVERIDQLDPDARIRSSAASRILLDRQDPEAERRRPLRHGEPDLAEPDDAERLPVQTVRLRVPLLVPRARPQVGHVVRDPPVDRQQEAHRQLCHGDRVAARHVRDVDPHVRGGVDIDR